MTDTENSGNGAGVLPIQAPLAEADLTFARKKPASIGVSAAYRLMGLARRFVPRERMLRFSLDAAWLARRLAFELSGEVFGPAFHTSTMGLNPEFLATWIPRGSAVLDVGCGQGRWSRFAARFAGQVVGIDHDPQNIARARQLAADEHLTNVDYVVGDVTRDLPARKFDLALLVHVIEHIEDVEGFLRSMMALTSVLVVEVPDFDSDSLNRPRQLLGCRFYADADHVREYTADILAAQLQRTGWSQVHQERRAGSLVVVARAGTIPEVR